MTRPNLIAFCGYSRAGKDTAAEPLIAAGYQRYCFGDIIKRQLDPLIREHFGFSAFTEDTGQKAKIRRTLEYWGDDNYDNIFREYFEGLPAGPVVNTKLMRLREALEWKRRGGAIWQIANPRVHAFGSFERDCLKEQYATPGLIDGMIMNDGDPQELRLRVADTFGLGVQAAYAEKEAALV